MAAYIGHVLSTVGPKLLLNSTKTLAILPCRHGSYNKKIKKNPKNYIKHVQFESRAKSLQSRGFMRNFPPYQPPDNVTEIVLNVFKEVTGSQEMELELDPEKKFQIFVLLNKELKHYAPNSILHKLKTLGDVLEFYNTPHEDINPYDRYKEMKLPPNLHILHDYQRFHPDTDTKFDGITAFPKSSTIVSSLKLKKKYKGFKLDAPWDDI